MTHSLHFWSFGIKFELMRNYQAGVSHNAALTGSKPGVESSAQNGQSPCAERNGGLVSGSTLCYVLDYATLITFTNCNWFEELSQTRDEF